MIGFVIRLVGYALVLGLTSRLAHGLWSNRGLDAVAALQPFHDRAITLLLVAPVALALIGFGRVRPVAIFVAGALVGAALTAPYVCAAAAGI